MVELYLAENCPYCVKVRVFLETNAVPYVHHPVSLSKMTPIKQELISLGGKGQVPYLVDKDKDVAMYESADIIDYVKKNYVKAN